MSPVSSLYCISQPSGQYSPLPSQIEQNELQSKLPSWLGHSKCSCVHIIVSIIGLPTDIGTIKAAKEFQQCVCWIIAGKVAGITFVNSLVSQVHQLHR
jgi:hypothetical protein